MRDVYLITSHEHRYVFYVYRCNQRTPDEIRAEWKFVDILHKNAIPVAPAIPTKKGELLIPFDAPEGTRFGVLAQYVDGKHLRHRPSSNAVKSYGSLIAQIHAVADGISLELIRPVIDYEILINKSMVAFDTVVTVRAEQKAYLHRVADLLHTKVDSLPRTKPLYGMIHGDVIRANAQVSDDGLVTVLDFDMCGFGWRAYDIASYLLAIKGLPEQKEFESAFLSGYQEIRSLARNEQEMLPLFMAVRAVFDIGVKASNVYHWGSQYLHTYLDQSMERLQQCMHEIR
jgi:Ser/Thr protein kinase RdoA (MazF antagonist)